ncbi:hypothetical protein BgiBS90_031144 [Biomphalaria glabrata]|nr:hypothetical protein BgiBS90_031144 [Biomphalaria glabrata]
MSIMICVDSVNKGTSALPVIIIAPPRGESEFLLEMNTNEELVNRPSESCQKGQHTLNSSMFNSHHDITRDSNYLTLISGTSASSTSGVPTSIDATPRIVLATTEFPIMPSLCIAKNNCYLLNSSSPENHNVTHATMTLYKTEESVALSKPRTTQHLENTTRSILHQSQKSCNAKDDHRQQNFLQQHRDPKCLSHLTGSFRTSFQENSAHVQTSSNLVSKSYTHNQLSSTHVSSQFAALPKKSFTKPSNLNEKPHKEGTRSLSSSLCYQTSADQTTTVYSTRCSPASSLADKSSSSVKSSTRSTSVHQYKLTNYNTSFNETVNAIEPMETFENTEPVFLQASNSNIATSTRPSDCLYSQGASFINSPTSSYTGALTSNSATPANGAASGSFGKQNGSHNVLRMESSSSPQPSRIPVQCIAVKQPTSSNSSLPVTSFASFRSPTVSPDSHMSPPEFSVKDSIPSRAESVQEQSDISPPKCSPSSSASLVPSSSASLVPSCSTSMLDMPATKSTETLRVDSGRQLRARNKSPPVRLIVYLYPAHQPAYMSICTQPTSPPTCLSVPSPPVLQLIYLYPAHQPAYLSICTQPTSLPTCLSVPSQPACLLVYLYPAHQSSNLSICTQPTSPPTYLSVPSPPACLIVYLYPAHQPAYLSICTQPTSPPTCQSVPSPPVLQIVYLHPAHQTA